MESDDTTASYFVLDSPPLTQVYIHTQANRSDQFQLSMDDTLWKNQPVCLLAYLFPWCFVAYTRYLVISTDMTQYKCFQGYMDNQFCRSGELGEKSCPYSCLCLEVTCCLGPSMSSTRSTIMDQLDLRPDPYDNRIIRFNNCLMCCSCLCDVMSIFCSGFRHCSRIIHGVSALVAYCTIGCMVSQVYNEVMYRQLRGDDIDYRTLPDEEESGPYFPFHSYTTHYSGHIIPISSSIDKCSAPFIKVVDDHEDSETKIHEL